MWPIPTTAVNKQVPITISAETSVTSQFPGGAVIVYYIQRGSVELDPLRIGFW